MTDNKSLTYLMQLEENTKSEFTEVKNKIDSIVDIKDILLESKNSILQDTEEILLKLDDIQLMFDSITYAVNESNQFINAIYYGNTIVDWIQDLKTNKKNSTTWKTQDRMETLIAYKPAVVDSSIAKLLFEYVVNNNYSVGSFLDLKFSTKNFENYLTIESMCVDEGIFTTLVTNTNAFNIVWSNSFSKTKFMNAAYSNKTVMEKTVKNNTKVRDVFRSKSSSLINSKGSSKATKSGYMFVSYVVNQSDRQTTYGKITTVDGTVEEYSSQDYEKVYVDKFATAIECSGGEWHGNYSEYSYNSIYGIAFA